MFTLAYVCFFWRKSKQRAPRVICSLWRFSPSTAVQESSTVLQASTWVAAAEGGRWNVPSSRHPLLAQSLGRSQPAMPPPAPSTHWYLLLEEKWLSEGSHSRGREREEERWDESSQTEGCHKVLPKQQKSNQREISLISKALQRKVSHYYFILGSFTSSHQSVGPCAPARKRASHLAVFIFIVIQQLQSMPGYLYHLPHKCHFSKGMVDTWGPRVQKFC